MIQDLPALFIRHVGLQHRRTELRCKRLGHLHGLADPRALDDHVLHVVLARQLRQFREEIPAQRAADTSVLQLNEVLFCLRDVVVFDESGVDVQTVYQIRQSQTVMKIE